MESTIPKLGILDADLVSSGQSTVPIPTEPTSYTRTTTIATPNGLGVRWEGGSRGFA